MLRKLHFGELSWEKFHKDISGRLNDAILRGTCAWLCCFFTLFLVQSEI